MLLLGLLLRLKGIHDPLLDHPGWRQGDTASIARNFAVLRYDILYPQTNYDGPPPNYVELELQIVPYLAATVYKIAGVHEIAGRLIDVAFSLGAIAMLAFFGRRLFSSAAAGLFAAFFFAVMPGSLYYGRTFMPDTAMVFFLTAALYAASRLLLEREHWRKRDVAGCTALLALALLAKPVAAVGLVPLAALVVTRAGRGRTMQWGSVAVLAFVPLAVLAAYDRFVAAHAEWLWASGITTRHVLPALRESLQSAAALHAKLVVFRQMLGVLGRMMIGPAISAIALLGVVFFPASTRSRTLIWAWLAGGLLYVFVVVTVERVDYYMYPLLPAAALAAGGVAARIAGAVRQTSVSAIRYGVAAVAFAALCVIVVQDRSIVAPYYRYSKTVYRDAVALDAQLAPGALVVMGHYDPAILYYIGRYGWEEDPYLWTPFDEESAIRKGARYFIDIETNRFNRNVELCAWMQRFPLLDSRSRWPVYETDPAKVKAGSQISWRAFRAAERGGHARAWLDARGLCRNRARAS